HSSWVLHLLHGIVARVDARGARDALERHSLADSDARRTYLDADVPDDVRADVAAARIDGARARAARLAAPGIRGSQERMAIEHRALKACVRAHVLAPLLAHVAGVAVGRKAIEQHPKPFPRPERECRDFFRAHGDRREVADERESREKGKPDPKRLFRA